MGWGLFGDDDSSDSDDADGAAPPSAPAPEGVEAGSDSFEQDAGSILAAPLQGEYALEGEEGGDAADDTTEQILKQSLGDEGYAAAVQKAGQGGAGGVQLETKAGDSEAKRPQGVKMPIVGVLSGEPPAAEIEARSASAVSKAPAPPLYKLSDFTTSSFARLLDALQGWVTQRTLALNGLGRAPEQPKPSPQPSAGEASAGSAAGGIGSAVQAAPGDSTAEYEKLDTVVVDASPQSAALARQVAQALSQVCRSCPRTGGPLAALLSPPVQRHVAGVMKTFEVFGDAHDFSPAELRALALVIALCAPSLREGRSTALAASDSDAPSVLTQWRRLLQSIGSAVDMNELRVLFGVLCGGHRHLLDQPILRAFMAASGLSAAEIEEARTDLTSDTAAKAEAEVSAASAAGAGAGGRVVARSVARAMPLVAGRPSREQLRNMTPEQQAEWGEVSRQAALRLIELRDKGASL